jgi:hypothetical protein
MPAGTPPEKLQSAVRNLAQEKFAPEHRYLMVLHTDQDHPHVHLVVKAVSEHGVRLNIRKETLREWRRDFAAHLREQGIEANATERAVRGATTPRKTDGIHRAALRGESTHYQVRARKVAHEVARGGVCPEPGLTTLNRTRAEVVHGWRGIAEVLDERGRREEAAAIRNFAARLPPVQTEKQWIAGQLRHSLARGLSMETPELSR